MMLDSFVCDYTVIESLKLPLNFVQIHIWYTVNTIQISSETAVLKKASSILDEPDSQQR